MDSTQLLLSAAVTITTVLLIVVGLQLISLLRRFKNNIKNENEIKKPDNPPAGGKKNKIVKKKVSLVSLLGKIKFLTPADHSHKKRFFKSS